jgi:hypothetical protein
MNWRRKKKRKEVNKMSKEVQLRLVSSGASGEERCPLCGAWMSTAFESCDHDFVTGICIGCGYYYWTEPGVADLEQVNRVREVQGLEPLKQLNIDLKDLDQLRLKHGLERLEEVPENWRRALNRIKKEVLPQDPTKKK